MKNSRSLLLLSFRLAIGSLFSHTFKASMALCVFAVSRTGQDPSSMLLHPGFLVMSEGVKNINPNGKRATGRISEYKGHCFCCKNSINASAGYWKLKCSLMLHLKFYVYFVASVYSIKNIRSYGCKFRMGNTKVYLI